MVPGPTSTLLPEQLTPEWAPRFRFGVLDAAIVALVLAVGVWSWPLLMAGPGRIAVVRVDGEAAARLQLTGKERQMTVQGRLGPLLLEYGEQGVRVLAAPCPNQLCVHQSWVKRAGGRIICLPSRIVVALDGSSGTSAAPDGVTY
jgi:hypothetical protein